MSVQKAPDRRGGVNQKAIHWEEDLRPFVRLPREPRRTPRQPVPAWIPALVSFALVAAACGLVATFINNNRPALSRISLGPTATVAVVTPTATELAPPTATPYAAPTATPVSPPTAAPVSDAPITVGAQVKIVDTGPNGLNFRKDPTTQAEKIRSLPEGNIYEVVGGPASADGYTWWQLKDPGDGITGWGAANYMRRIAQP